jgi:hypothetical protein
MLPLVTCGHESILPVQPKHANHLHSNLNAVRRRYRVTSSEGDGFAGGYSARQRSLTLANSVHGPGPAALLEALLPGHACDG